MMLQGRRLLLCSDVKPLLTLKNPNTNNEEKRTVDVLTFTTLENDKNTKFH